MRCSPSSLISNLKLIMFAQSANKLTRKMFPLTSFGHFVRALRSGSVFCSVEKREPAELAPAERGSNILGSFRIKVLLQGTVFLLHKRPNIFIVLT